MSIETGKDGITDMKRRSDRRKAARKRRISALTLGMALALCAALIVTGRPGGGEAAEAMTQTTAQSSVTEAQGTENGIFQAADLFTSQDLTQEADLTEAVYHTLTDGEEWVIDQAGVYVIDGTAKNATVTVAAAEDAKVQLVLNGLNAVNDGFPCIYVKSCDKVFVTVMSDSSLSVTGAFQSDGDVNTDGVIYSKCDLTVNGTGKLTVSSSQNGIVGKDDVKITGASLVISAASKAVEGKDSIRIAGGEITLTAGTDGLHAENSDDDSKGYVYICGGEIAITAGDDGIHGTSVVQIDGGNIAVTAAEGIEGTYVQINGGSVTISGRDDGINAGKKSSAYTPTIEVNGGEITVVMASGDTDGIDSNGNIIVNGGTVSVTGSSTFDYDGVAQYNGGTIIVNGQQVNSIPNQMMGGMGGMGGQMGGQMGGKGGRR